MEFFKIRRDIPFMENALIFNVVSLITFLAAVFFLFSRGLHLSVEFTGGTVMEVNYSQPADIESVRRAVSGLGYTDVQVQNFGTARDVLIRLPAQKGVSSAQQSERTLEALKATDPAVTLRRVEFVGPQVGEELVSNGLKALAMVVAGIMIYLAIRFEWKFAVAAIITTLHDVIVVAGWFALSGHEFDLTVLAGILSVMGYSINDTIVVFDRVRENFRSMRADPETILNRSINQTLSRTVITSFVAFLTVVALYIYGGGSLRGMAESQMLGIIIGTVSSIFVACPLLTLGFLKVTKQDLLPKAKDDAALARRP